MAPQWWGIQGWIFCNKLEKMEPKVIIFQRIACLINENTNTSWFPFATESKIVNEKCTTRWRASDGASNLRWLGPPLDVQQTGLCFLRMILVFVSNVSSVANIFHDRFWSHFGFLKCYKMSYGELRGKRPISKVILRQKVLYAHFLHINSKKYFYKRIWVRQ